MRVIKRATFFVVLLLSVTIFSLMSFPYFFGTEQEDIDNIEAKFFLKNTTKVFAEQNKFRQNAIKAYNLNLAAIQQDRSLDSTFTNNPVANKIGIRYLLPKTKTSFVIPLNNHVVSPAALVRYDTLFIEFSIDESKIDSIIQSKELKKEDFSQILADEDYIKITKSVSNHLSILGVVIFICVSIFVYFLGVFWISQEIKSFKQKKIASSKSIEAVSTQLDTLEDQIVNELKNSSPEVKAMVFTKRFHELRELVRTIEQNSNSYFILENMVMKAEYKMNEVQSRSNLMLASGLIMAFLGAVFFYFTLPASLGNSSDIIRIITLSIRPTLILLFIEAISWYLLKQHKNLLADYKYYHSIYNKKQSYLSTYKLINQPDFEKNSLNGVIPVMMLTEKYETANGNDQGKGDEKKDTENEMYNSLIDKILSKF